MQINCFWSRTFSWSCFCLCCCCKKSYFVCFSRLLEAELPPPYTAIASPDAGGVPVINCRVCQSIINLDGKLHQHVVKCTVCNEATVSGGWRSLLFSWYLLYKYSVEFNMKSGLFLDYLTILTSEIKPFSDCNLHLIRMEISAFKTLFSPQQTTRLIVKKIRAPLEI